MSISPQPKKVIIIGAGIGGLSCAHELSKTPEQFDIHVIDRHPNAGGLARSSVNEEDKHSEICWKAISSGYINLLQILDTVTDNSGIKLIAHLKPLERFIYAFNDRNIVEAQNSFITRPSLFKSGFKTMYNKNVPIKDQIKLLWFLFKAQYSCEERLASYDKIKWSDWVNSYSEEVKRWILDSTAIYLGMDYKNISKQFMMQLVRDDTRSPLINNQHLFWSFDGPMSEVFIEPWKEFLKKKGVHFHMEVTAEAFEYKKDEIHAITFKHMENFNTADADIFVNAMGCEQLAKIYPESPETVIVKNKYEKLAALGHQIQAQILFYINRRTFTDHKPTIAIFPDSPWFLMTRLEANLWETKDCDLLSTGIGIWDRPGLIYAKTALECTPKELAEECWYQITESKHNMLWETQMPEWDLWHNVYSDEKGIDTSEPKFSNNVGTLELRPQCADTYFTNLYHATAYTRTNMNVYNMESASEAGVNAALRIRGETVLSRKPSYFTRFMRFLDRLLWPCC